MDPGWSPGLHSSSSLGRRKIDAMDRNTRRRSRSATSPSERFPGRRLRIRLGSWTSRTQIRYGSLRTRRGQAARGRAAADGNLHPDKTGLLRPQSLDVGFAARLRLRRLSPFCVELGCATEIAFFRPPVFASGSVCIAVCVLDASEHGGEGTASSSSGTLSGRGVTKKRLIEY